jgi:hypothetical protein
VAGSGNYLSKLSFGATIGSSSTWITGAKFLENYGGSAWDGSNGGSSYIGFRLLSGATDYYYGWVALSYNDSSNNYTISEFALNSTLNQSITSGQTVAAVPEPAASALLLATGAAGLALYRRRRKAAAAVVATS